MQVRNPFPFPIPVLIILAIIILFSLVKICSSMTLSIENAEVVQRINGKATKLGNVVARDTSFAKQDSAAFQIVCQSNVNFHSIGFDVAWSDTSIEWGGVIGWGDVFPNYPQQRQVNIWDGYFSVLWYVPSGASTTTIGERTILRFAILTKMVEKKVKIFFRPL